VVDNDGLSDSDTVNITVENRAPIAAASADVTSGTAPLTVNFDSIGSIDPDAPYGMITGYSWNFGDGVSSNTANPSHTYNDAGIFTATLTVTDDFGDTGTATVEINVSQPPTASIVFSANGYKEKGVKKVDLSWGNATTDYVDIYRDGTLIDTIPNSSPYAYTDNIGKGRGSSYTYRVCESSSTSNCSNTVTVRLNGKK
jgi:PKD repeat protein